MKNKYAFSGDDTHIIRVTSDAEWLEYAVEPNGYFVFNTAFHPMRNFHISRLKVLQTEKIGHRLIQSSLLMIRSQVSG